MWNETFEIEVEPHDKLILDVYDENRVTRDDFLGRAIIDTSSVSQQPNNVGYSLLIEKSHNFASKVV